MGIMEPMSNADYLTRLKYADEYERLREARKKSGLTFKELAEKLGVSKMWIASVFDGQQYVPEAYAEKLAAVLGLPPDRLTFLTEHPYKGNTDPILYRLHEVIDTYGPAIKAIIHEEGGNAIMSAIDFGLDVNVITDAEGNHRVIITMDGKLLPYAKKGKYPW
jgi:cyanate lyase